MSNNNQHIPSGYKASPLGIIPEDWEVKRLGEIGDFSKGNGVPKDKIIKDEHGHPCLTYGDLYTKYDFVIKDIKSFIDDDVASESKEIHIGDICFAGSGETPEDIGKCAAYIEERTAYAGGDIIILSPNKDINSIWLSYVLNSDIGGKQRYKSAQGFSIVHIYPDNLKRIQIPIPTLKEQHRIVSVLSLWDTAIAKQTAMIEQLTLRKRGLKQQLLTGKKRLKGFEGEWKEVRLGEVALVIGGGTPNTNISDYWDGDIPWFTPSEIGENKYVNISERTISEKGLHDSSAKILPKGTILFTSRATIGAKAILTTEATTNQGFQSLVVINGNNNEFIYYYLDIIINEIKQKASGSTFPEVSAESIRKTAIKIPNVNEQNAIASVLVNADKEIEIQKQKLSDLQEQKRGLMQVLLTGKRRIKKMEE